MGLMDKMMERKMGKMSKEEKQNMMEKMKIGRASCRERV